MKKSFLLFFFIPFFTLISCNPKYTPGRPHLEILSPTNDQAVANYFELTISVDKPNSEVFMESQDNGITYVGRTSGTMSYYAQNAPTGTNTYRFFAVADGRVSETNEVTCIVGYYPSFSLIYPQEGQFIKDMSHVVVVDASAYNDSSSLMVECSFDHFASSFAPAFTENHPFYEFFAAPPSEGTNTLEVRAVSTQGFSHTETVSYILDTNLPSVSFDSHAYADTIGSSARLFGTAADNFYLDGLYFYYYDGTSDIYVVPEIQYDSPSNMTWSASVADLPGGDNYFYFLVSDKAGNTFFSTLLLQNTN